MSLPSSWSADVKNRARQAVNSPFKLPSGIMSVPIITKANLNARAELNLRMVDGTR